MGYYDIAEILAELVPIVRENRSVADVVFCNSMDSLIAVVKAHLRVYKLVRRFYYFPFQTRTNPTAQTDAREALAVSKSRAV